MAHDRLQAAVPDGEALRYRTALRGGGAVGITDERLLVVDGDPVSVELTAIDEVTAREVDWFVAVLSAALAGIGVVTAGSNLLLGVAFVAAGIGSLVLVYRKRGKVIVEVDGRGKPLSFHVAATDEFLDRLGERLDRYEQRLRAESEET